MSDRHDTSVPDLMIVITAVIEDTAAWVLV